MSQGSHGGQKEKRQASDEGSQATTTNGIRATCGAFGDAKKRGATALKKESKNRKRIISLNFG